MAEALLQTTVVGSYPQPDWLVDRSRLSGHVPRIRARDIWRVADEFLEAAQDDATVLAIRDMERAGIDIITDGEMRRESYSNRFATALDGVDIDNPGTVIFTKRSVLAFRNFRSRTSTACFRRILPATRGTGFGWPLRSSAVPGLSRSTPSSAVAKRLE